MHYKRRSRRRDKRTLLPCGCCEDIRGGKGAPQIEENEVCTGKSYGKRGRKPKERCPTNGTHEWYREWVNHGGVDIKSRPGYHKCPDCTYAPYQRWVFDRTINVWGWNYCAAHRIERRYVDRERVDTCIHCWTERKVKGQRIYEDGGGTWSWRGAKKLPRRTVKLY